MKPLVPTGTALDAAERERYARHLRLAGFGLDNQSRLKAAHALVIGAGGLGSPILLYLAAAGIGEITVVDPDVVELSNLQRQVIHTEDSVGQAKVASAAASIHALNPTVKVNAKQVLITADNALELAATADVVLDGSDNFATRYLVNDACEILDLPYIWGSILGFEGQVSVFYSRGGTGATYRDLHPSPPPPGSVPDCSEAGVLGVLCATIGAAMGNEAIKLICGIGTPLTDTLALYSALSGRWEYLDVLRDVHRADVQTLPAGLTGSCTPASSSAARSTFAGSNPAGTCAAGTSNPTSPTPSGNPTSPTPSGNPASPTPASNPASTNAAGGSLGEMSVAQLRDHLAAGGAVIDVREDAEVAAGMVPGAQHLPMAEILAQPQAYAELAGAVLYCRAGVRSAQVQAVLGAHGIEVYSLLGGYLAYLSEEASAR